MAMNLVQKLGLASMALGCFGSLGSIGSDNLRRAADVYDWTHNKITTEQMKLKSEEYEKTPCGEPNYFNLIVGTSAVVMGFSIFYSASKIKEIKG